MAVVLSKALKAYSLEGAAENLNFADIKKFSSYAKDPIAKIVEAGIINGKKNNFFDPTGVTTKAEVVTIIYKTLNYIM